MQNITQTLLPGLQPVGTGSVLITVNGVAVGTLSPQEVALYSSLFKTAIGPRAIQTSTTIPGNAAANFLKRSGLTKKQLHDIWTLADNENQGYLLPNGFYKACRLVAHAQSSTAAIAQDLLAIEPQVLPYFEGSEGGKDGVWKLTEEEISRYSTLYRREGGDAKLDGTDARALLMKSGLSSSELCEIWDLGDADKDGKLTFGEFLVVMQLVSKVRDGKAFLPAELPATLAQYLRTPLPSVAAPAVGTSMIDRAALAVGAPPSNREEISTPLPSDTTFAPKTDSRPGSRIGFGFKSEEKVEREASGETLLRKEILGEHEGIATQVGRRQQFRRQMLDGRSRLENLRAEARRVELDLVSKDHEVSKVQDQILSLNHQVTEVEEELDEFRRESGQVSLGGDLLTAVATIREAIGEDEREVLELRAQLERIQREKTDLQSANSVLLEKKRQADQDRNLLIVGLESDRAKLVSVRAERLKLWEQRHQLTRELTTKTFDQITAGGGRVTLASGALQSASPPTKNRDKKGVRAETVSVPQFAQFPPQEQTWNKFGGSNEHLGDPLAGAFGMNAAPQFGTQ